MTVSLIAALSLDHAIGVDGHLPWHLPEDMARFKSLTLGHTVIMGRKTYESLPSGALTERRNIVLSRTLRSGRGIEVCRSLEEALAACRSEEEVFVIGGSSVYEEAMPVADRLYLTLVDKTIGDADAFFPSINHEEWVETKKEKHDGFSFINLRRKR